ncbi:MAG: gliding motility-associated C-terminal domain-containing protein [Flavobacteriales bacterium]|nr:gliding motility-associated C-terminal domain-containing protein [Flavobacteriales bacterium]
MKAISFVLALLLAHFVMAQQPAPAPKPVAQPEPCQLLVPTSISINMESVPQVQCDCRITKFNAKIYSRWGQELFATADPALFPGGLLKTEKLQSGTYMWIVEYTAIVGADPVERKTTGYINVL